ncbi:MAG TPA: PilZ domain-containing protein [Candidatus Acidoferrales bacterium]|nr:PilZ domain-containing protein [Candidatus Acidoferrales bacterium]
MIVLPVTASHPASRPNERRRNARLRVPSIIYAQLGSSYGGIVVNLGLDGISCLTAARLPAEKNLSFPMKLRGAGLNVELTGEVVWLGATQKKAGIRFKDLSPEARKEISEWIVRESQLFGPVAMDTVSPMDSKSGFSAGGQNPSSRPISLAPAVSPGASASPDAAEDLDEPESKYERPSAALLKSPVITPSAAPHEQIAPGQTPSAPAGNPAVRDAALNVDFSAPKNEFQGVPRPRNDALFDPLPIEKAYQFPAQNSAPAAVPEKVTPPAPESRAKTEPARVPETKISRPPSAPVGAAPVAFPRRPEPIAGEKPRPAAVSAAKSEPVKVKPPEPVAAASRTTPAVSQEKSAAAKAPAAKSDASKSEKVAVPAVAAAQNAAQTIDALASQAADLWIPAGLREAWKRADRSQRQLLAGLGVACVGSFLLILILTIVHVSGSSSRPVQSVSRAAAGTSAVVADGSDSTADSTEPAAVDPDQPPSANPFMNLVNFVFGIKSELNQPFGRHAVAIDPAHVAVPVWTSKTSGFYYCTDSDYYKLVTPGRFMTQRDALQNGYQPKLGRFCD